MPRYNFAITTKRGEKFEAVDCHSFDEAIRLVEKGIYERDIELETKNQVKLPIELVKKVPTSSAVDSDVKVPPEVVTE